jgi:hypothetical protein
MGSMPALTETQEMIISANPDRLIMRVDGLSGSRARNLANVAVREARRVMPKLTGAAASRLFPLYGQGFFGIGWLDGYTWFQEQGIRAFTMFSLKGKTIPMWVDDPTGTEREKNPRAQTRMTLSGKTQVLIFRKAVDPGAPGRISKRETSRPFTSQGKVAGAIAKGNVGVKWRHPGLAPRKFLNHAVTLAAEQGGISPNRIYAADRTWRQRFLYSGNSLLRYPRKACDRIPEDDQDDCRRGHPAVVHVPVPCS